MIYERLLRPALFRLWPDAEDAHHGAMAALVRVAGSPALRSAVRAVATVRDARLAREIWGLKFANPVGLAAGFDKDGLATGAWEALGFGFVELGTVTARPQPGNDRPRVFRLPASGALINRFGFNNLGAAALAARLAAGGGGVHDARRRGLVVGISLGKSKVTPVDEAVGDYLHSLRALHDHGDYFAVNVSSPNTPGLRGLQGAEELDRLLAALAEERDRLASAARLTRPKPLLLKLAPDLSDTALDEALDVATARRIDGIIAVNTTIVRECLGLEGPDGRLPAAAHETGGLSGAPLRPRALEVVRHIRTRIGDTPIIGVGGIMSGADATAMLAAGADLIQVYTGFVYGGPLFAGSINRAIAAEGKLANG